MIHKLKTLALALVAVLAMSAVVASATQAQFTANKYPTMVTAISSLGNDDFKTEGGSVECKVHYEGQLVEGAQVLEVTPAYTECKAFGFAESVINMNGCRYLYHSDGTFDIACPTGKSIVTTSGACELQIGSQTGLKSVDLTSNGAHIDFKMNVTGIAYTVTKDGFLCPFNGTGAKTGATYTQNSEVTLKPVSGGTSISIG